MSALNALPPRPRACTHSAYLCSVFLLSNIALGAYLIGTITLLLTKNDERTGR